MNGKLLGAVAVSLALICTALAAPAYANFGIHNFDLRFIEEDGSPATQAGSHPFAMETFFETNYTEVEPGRFEVDGGDFKDVVIEAAKGLIGAATAVPRCSTLDFATRIGGSPSCPDSTAVGVTAALVEEPDEALVAAIYNLTPPPGVPVRLGFAIQDVPLVIDVSLKQAPDYNVRAAVVNAPQPLTVFGNAAQIWGVPADFAHDFARGACAASAFGSDVKKVIVDGHLNFDHAGSQRCDAEGAPRKPLLTLPRSCEGPLASGYEVDSWSVPGSWVRDSVPLASFDRCGDVGFDPDIASRTTVNSADTGTGLDFEIDFEDEVNPGSEGLIDPDGIAQSEMKEIAVTLPTGVTVNPSIAEGLGVCTSADLDRETLSSEPGEGCPENSKIGAVEVRSPLIDQPIDGSVFLAQQNDPDTAARENPFDALIAFYIVLKNKDLGVSVKVPAKVEPDPRTGQLVTTARNIPQIPFFRFRFHFKEGQRAALVSPPTCGIQTTKADFVPWAHPSETVIRTASFAVDRGTGGGACPPGGVAPSTRALKLAPSTTTPPPTAPS